MTRFYKDEKGQALVEFVLVMLPFFALIFGIIQLALIINAQSIVNYAAYTAARVGVVNEADESKMRTAATIVCMPLLQQDLRGSDNTIPIPLQIKSKTSAEGYGRNLEVRVTYYYHLFGSRFVWEQFATFKNPTPLLGFIPITASCIMTTELPE